MNKVSRDMADKRAPDYSYELRFIKEYMEKNFVERITLQKLKKELSSLNLLTTPPSTTTISKLLNKKLNYSFKKSVGLRMSNNPEISKLKFKEAIKIQLHLQRSGVEVIYIDEFSL